ncbi:MAG TPA: ABC transporter substrate-binding protein [Thermoleophilia bacterium]|nr:ABC transporter substrate-binding protein [Thermoleophilia bacterium]
MALAAAIALLVAACGGGGDSGTTSGDGDADVATFAYTRTPVTNWDPAVEFAEGVITLHNVYETLLRYDPAADSFTPVLAESYTKTEDGKTWTFKIRQGVKFHDGTDLDAEAVKFSIERTIELGQGAAFIWGPVKSIDVLDPYTVQFTLTYAAPIDLISASAYGAFIVSPTAVNGHPDDWLTQGNEAGTGPYMLQTYQPGQQVVLTKFPEYWGGWDGKHYEKAVIQVVSEAATKRQLVTKGDVDITMELPAEDIEALKSDPNVDVVIDPSFQNLFLMMNTQVKPMDNVLVRQAMSYAFPYEDIIKYAMGGLATQGKGPVPYGMWGHGEELFQYTTDLAKAKELMAQAGLADQKSKITFVYASGDETQRKCAELWKANLSQIGIDLVIQSGPWEAIWEKAKTTPPAKAQGVYSLYWWPDVTNPYSFLYAYHTEDPPVFNFAYWYDADYDKMIDDGNVVAGVDREKAAQMFIDAQEYLIEQATAVFPFDQQYAFVVSKQFGGFVSNPSYAHVVFFYECYPQ